MKTMIQPRRVCLLMLLLILVIGATVLPCGAASGSDEAFFALPEEYREMLRALPQAVRDSLPEDLFSADANEQQRALEAFLSPSAAVAYLIEVLLADLTRPLSLLLQIGGILLLRAVFECLSSSLGDGSRGAFSLLCRLCFCLVLLKEAFSLLEGVSAYFEALTQLTSAYLPVIGATYMAGGNAATAAVNQSTLIFSTSLVSVLGGESVVPFMALCLMLTLAGITDGSTGARMAHLAAKLKKWYTTALALTMLLLGAVLAAQTTLAARADSLTFKTVRFVVSSHIPHVGGGVAEMLRSAATGVSWLRSLVGVGGVIMLLALLLPTVGRVLLSRWVCSLGADVAAWLGCGEEGRLLTELAQLYGYLLAVVTLSCMTFFFSLVLLMQCTVAFG